jgi:hypothetical protein
MRDAECARLLIIRYQESGIRAGSTVRARIGPGQLDPWSGRHGGCANDDAKIRRAAGSNLFREESDVLTPTEMEDRLENLDRRLDRIEQMLPTLATKGDLKAFATRDEMRELFEEATHQAKLLHEDLVERIKLLGEGRPKRR